MSSTLTNTICDSRVPLPPEVARLNSLVSDIASNPPQMGPGYSLELVRSYFYDRVFGYRDGPEPLKDDEAGKSTIHEGEKKTLADLRRHILDVIDDLTAICMQQAKCDQDLSARSQCTSFSE